MVVFQYSCKASLYFSDAKTFFYLNSLDRLFIRNLLPCNSTLFNDGELAYIIYFLCKYAGDEHLNIIFEMSPNSAEKASQTAILNKI